MIMKTLKILELVIWLQMALESDPKAFEVTSTYLKEIEMRCLITTFC